MDRQSNSLSLRPNLSRPAQPPICRVYQKDRQSNSLSLSPYSLDLSKRAQRQRQSRRIMEDNKVEK
jgi:hypothetical protein